ncbi:MAG: hypothetical protein U1G05_00100 [Kiritimatiellia bacterium]
MEPVARRLLGDPNPALSKSTELRYGSRGSLAIDLSKGVWRDHEKAEGGGVLDLIQRELQIANGAALNWLRSEGFELGPLPFDQRIEKVYKYNRADGELAFEVVRLHSPKDFRQRAPNGKWKVSGIRPVLYRLPELLASPVDSPVFITEGEKDADRLASLEIVATTNPSGAGK